MTKTKKFLSLFIIGAVWIMAAGNAFPFVVREGNKTYIVDRRGERWDVTQAESLGFNPEGFQYGLGRDAFTPLDDSNLSNDTESVSSNIRIIGVSEGSEARAYSVPKLVRHEIANSRIGGKPIAVGY